MANMFDENGNYNKTEWKPGDRITAGKLNKIEESLEAINNNDIERHKEADERLDALEEQKEAVEERFDELEDLVADNKSEVDTAIYEVHSKMDRLETKLDDGIDTVEAIAHTVDDKIADADASMKAQVAEVEADLEGLHAKDEELSEQLADITNKTKISVTDFGAIGDNATDNTLAFKELSEFLISEQMKYGRLYDVVIPPGRYLLKDTFNIPKCSIWGYQAFLVFDCSNKSLVTFITPHDDPWTFEVNIKGLTITTTETENYTNIGIDMRATSQLLMQDIYISRCDIGIMYQETSINSIIRPTIQRCNTAIFIGEYGNTLNIQNCDFWRNNVGFKLEGGVSSILVSDSYLEEQDIDILCEDISRATIIDNFVFDKVHIVKMNQLNKENDTYVLKTIASSSYSLSGIFKFLNCHIVFTPENRKHYFAFHDAKSLQNSKITICSEYNNVYYTYPQEGDTYLFKTVNNEVQEFCVINNYFKKNDDVELYNGKMWKNGLDTSNRYYSLVNSQLTFDLTPNSEKAKSLFYNHYTDRMIFKNSEGTNLPIICGNPVGVSKSYATELNALRDDFNNLLEILKTLKIINLK